MLKSHTKAFYSVEYKEDKHIVFFIVKSDYPVKEVLVDNVRKDTTLISSQLYSVVTDDIPKKVLIHYSNNDEATLLENKECLVFNSLLQEDREMLQNSLSLTLLSASHDLDISLVSGSKPIPINVQITSVSCIQNTPSVKLSNVCINFPQKLYGDVFLVIRGKQGKEYIREIVLGRKRPKLQSIINKVNPAVLVKAVRYIKRNKGKNILKKIVDYSSRSIDEYSKAFVANKPTAEYLELQTNSELEYQPLISIITPTFNTPIDALKSMLDSVVNQTYTNWELCIADGSTDDNPCISVLKEYSQNDHRIRAQKLEKNLGISGNTNVSIQMAKGDYIGLLDHDDFLEPNALFEIVSSLQKTHHDVIYTDEDKFDESRGLYMDPYFKPDFNYDLLLCSNYITHFFVVKRSISEMVGGLHSEYDGSQDYDFILRCTSMAKSVYHIRKILYHWRIIPGSTAADPSYKMYCFESGRKALFDHLAQRGIDASVIIHPLSYGYYDIKYEQNNKYRVSVVIDSYENSEDISNINNLISFFSKNGDGYEVSQILVLSDNPDLLNRIVDTDHVNIVHGTDYSNELYYQLNKTDSQMILFINQNCSIPSSKSIDDMLSYFVRNEVAAVTPLITYRNEIVEASAFVDDHHVVHIPYCGTVASWEGYMRHLTVSRNVVIPNESCSIFRKELIIDQLKMVDFDMNELKYLKLGVKLNEMNKLIVFSPNIVCQLTENIQPSCVSYEAILRIYESRKIYFENCSLDNLERINYKYNGI